MEYYEEPDISKEIVGLIKDLLSLKEQNLSEEMNKATREYAKEASEFLTHSYNNGKCGRAFEAWLEFLIEKLEVNDEDDEIKIIINIFKNAIDKVRSRYIYTEEKTNASSLIKIQKLAKSFERKLRKL